MWLHEWSRGKEDALDALMPIVHAELHRQATNYLRRERIGHTLQATALINEVYLKLIDQREVNWQNRAHFFAIAAQAMRRILVDHARARHANKRGGVAEDLPLEEALLAVADEANVDIVALDEALRRLAAVDPEQERLVELRYFGGLSLEDAASALGISRASAGREWQMAKAWLKRELTR
jgi:RNA polymerase sigma factor (TIGR02999 family)